MKKINQIKIGELVGTVYQTTLKGRIYYVYKIASNKQIIAESYSYIDGLDRATNLLKLNMEILTNQKGFSLNV